MKNKIKRVTTIENAYYNEVKDIPLLSAQEEKELFIKYKNGDINAQNKIIVSNLRLVRSIAIKRTNNFDDYMDLVQEGNIGLIKAVELFDYKRGYKFSTFATIVINQVIDRYLSEKNGPIKYPVYVTEIIKKVNYERKLFEQENFREPSLSEIADRLDMSLEQLTKTLNSLHNICYLDELIYDNNNRLNLKEIIPSPNSLVEENSEMLISEDRNVLKNSLKQLNSRESYVIEERYGLITGEGRTLRSLGEELNLSKERVRQIEEKSKDILREDQELKDLAVNAMWNKKEYVSYGLEYEKKAKTR